MKKIAVICLVLFVLSAVGAFANVCEAHRMRNCRDCEIAAGAAGNQRQGRCDAYRDAMREADDGISAWGARRFLERCE